MWKLFGSYADYYLSSVESLKLRMSIAFQTCKWMQLHACYV
jgi:hypothetical protein